MRNSDVQVTRSWKAWLAAAVAGLVLVGCGGGGGGGDSTPPPSGTTIVDSFGQVVSPGDGSGVGAGDAGADGTAGEGKPIVGGTVELTDFQGRVVRATTDSQGYYRLKITGFTAPYVIKVTKPDGKVLRSLSTTGPKTNAFVTMNITGLTDKVASDVARAGGKQGAADLTPQIVASNQAAISQSIDSLRSTLQPVISASGVPTSSFDPLSAPFRADHTGYDFVLDNTTITYAPDGSTQVAVSSAFTPALQGNWEFSVLVEGQKVVIGTFPASAVPTQQAILSATAADAAKYVAPSTASSNGYTITTNGNTSIITGPGTNYTLVINSYSFSNYQGCGSCGIGSTVSVDMNITFTESGTLDGYTIPTSTTSFMATISYKRVS